MNNNNKENSISTIETFGVEQIPDHERTAGPTDLFRMIFGGSNTFATAVLGSFPVLFGLSFQAGAWAIVLGGSLTLGLASLMYLALLSLFPEPAAVFGPDDPRSKSTDSLTRPAMGQTA